VLSTEAASFWKRGTSCGYRKRIIRRKSKEPPRESSSRSNCINNDCEAPGQGPQRRYPRKPSKRRQTPLNTFYRRREPALPPQINKHTPIGQHHHQWFPTSPFSPEQDLPTSRGSRPSQLRLTHCYDRSPCSTNRQETREPRPDGISPERQSRNPHHNQTRQN
jgi:hypothetical protein